MLVSLLMSSLMLLTDLVEQGRVPHYFLHMNRIAWFRFHRMLVNDRENASSRFENREAIVYGLPSAHLVVVFPCSTQRLNSKANVM